MLSGGSKKAPVESKVGGRWKNLEYKEERLLYEPVTVLRAGRCEYELAYIIYKQQRAEYFNQRDALLRRLSSGSARTPESFNKLPGDSFVQRGRYLEFETQGYGAFGWVTDGVDAKTGDPIAIKELLISSYRNRIEAVAEVNIGKRFVVSFHWLQTLRYLMCRRTYQVSVLSSTHGASMVIAIHLCHMRSQIF